jgi:hypothetical protein
VGIQELNLELRKAGKKSPFCAASRIPEFQIMNEKAGSDIPAKI